MIHVKQGFEIIGAVPRQPKDRRAVVIAFAPARKELRRLLAVAASRKKRIR